MKKILICVIYYFTLINVCDAQLLQERLDQSKNYLNSKITYLMLSEYVKTDKKSRPNFETIKPFFENLNIGEANSFSELNKTLKVNFKSTLKKLSVPINDINTNDLINLSKEEAAKKMTDSSFAILEKEYSEIFKTLSSKKDSFISEITLYLGEINSPIVPPSDPTVINNVPDNGGIIKTKGFFSFSYFSFWTLLPLLVCLGLLFFIIRLMTRLDERIEKRKEEIERLSSANTFDNSQYRNIPINNSDFEKMLRKSDTIQKIINEMVELKSGSAIFKTDTKDFIQSAVPQFITQESPQTEIFYMAGPVNNYFPNTAKSQTKENTVYKFTLKLNKQEANYEIHTLGAPINEILSMVESYIKPACDEENIPGGSVKNIVTKKHGKAILEGDKWMIKSKAIIRYE